MSEDHVKFFLPSKYFQRQRTSNGMSRGTCEAILKKAFGLYDSDLDRLMRGHTEGFTIVCRPSQFARFIVYRADANECINGVKDLKPELFKPRNLYTELSEQFSVSECTVKGLARALGYAHGGDSHVAGPQCNFVDVSKNPHTYSDC